MKPEIAEQWACALESGEFVQGRNNLRMREEGGDTYCCLGVLAELSFRAGVLGEWSLGDPDISSDPVWYGIKDATYDEWGVLTERIQQWSGLTSLNGTYDDGDKLRSLSRDNDSGQTFAEIAATIRARKDEL